MKVRKLFGRAAVMALALVLIPLTNIIGACIGPLDEEPV